MAEESNELAAWYIQRHQLPNYLITLSAIDKTDRQSNPIIIQPKNKQTIIQLLTNQKRQIILTSPEKIITRINYATLYKRAVIS